LGWGIQTISTKKAFWG